MDRLAMDISTIAVNVMIIACFILPLRQRKSFIVKSIGSIAAYAVFYFAMQKIFPQNFLAVAAMQLFTVAICFFLVEGSVLSQIYLTVWIVMVQGTLSMLWEALQKYIVNVLHIQPGSISAGVRLWILYAVFAIPVLLIVYFFFSTRMPVRGKYETGPRQTVSAVLILFLFNMLQFRHIIFEADHWIMIKSFAGVFLGMYALVFLYLQFALFRGSAMEKELVLMDLLAKKQKEQYELSRENIALINRKTHDLKHQMQALRQMDDSEHRKKYLDEIDESIQIYESIIKTGCDVLDILLTEKSLLCKERGIEIHCVADGERLNFMDPVDLYSVFGNILDNAIEEVQRFKHKEERQIDVLIFCQSSFLIINISNPLKQTLEFEDQLPRTTKENNGYHGFGLKSVKHVIETYGGNMRISTDGGIFALKILIPMSD